MSARLYSAVLRQLHDRTRIDTPDEILNTPQPRDVGEVRLRQDQPVCGGDLPDRFEVIAEMLFGVDRVDRCGHGGEAEAS